MIYDEINKVTIPQHGLQESAWESKQKIHKYILEKEWFQKFWKF